MTLQKIPWVRLAAEGVVIIGSILIAFAVDAWWEERLEREDERRYLMSLHQEFQQSLEMIVARGELRSDVFSSHSALIHQVQGAERGTDESLFYDFSLLSMPLQIEPPRAVLDDLVSSGGTLLIRSDEIRVALARYVALLKNSDQASASAWAVWEERIQPFIEGRIPRLDRLRLGAFSDYDRLTGTGGSNFPFSPSQHIADFDGVFGDPVFEDMLAERWLRVENTVGEATKLTESVEEIISLIEAELGPPEP